ncbi:binding-protein-dependent transport system inner membrane protein [Caballeronia sordidicola]|uniref:Binding-protein-dependent transport system inner membrane protein n=1 Tax=Caballeronia sordidicola TaxID=196367 RepID=A0A158G5Q5_CABSO|nr:ABC transporter permease [Caballeronia sordidicola]SAL27435.1 binding-protein-dependent transport system inner membrane protein [Caballeronia sordidicola]
MATLPSTGSDFPAQTSRWAKIMSLALQRLSLLVVFLLLWWLASQRMPAFILPGIGKTWAALLDLIKSGTFSEDLGITFYRVVAGFTLAAIVGTPLGIVLGSNRRVGTYCEPVLSVLNTVSAAIWAIFALIWFGISNGTTIFVVFMEAMPLILTNVWQGAQSVNAEYVELARSFQMSRAKVMRKIYLPTVLPYFFSGARLAFGFGWRVSLVAETIGSSNGIGYRLRQAADLVQTDQVFAWTLTLVALMVLLEYGILKPLENYLFRWKRRI